MGARLALIAGLWASLLLVACGDDTPSDAPAAEGPAEPSPPTEAPVQPDGPVGEPTQAAASAELPLPGGLAPGAARALYQGHCRVLASAPTPELCACVGDRMVAEAPPTLSSWAASEIVRRLGAAVPFTPDDAQRQAWLDELGLTPSQARMRLLASAARANLACGGNPADGQQ